jgi:uncharacterized membrane protein
MADAVRDQIVVAADPDTILDVIADFPSYPDWQSDIKAVEVLDTDEHGWATRVRFTVDAKLFTTTLVLAYTYEDTAMRWHLVEGDQIRRNDGAYELEDLGDGTTRVTYSLEIEPAVPVPGMMRRKAAKRIVDSALSAMKQRVESLA